VTPMLSLFLSLRIDGMGVGEVDYRGLLAELVLPTVLRTPQKIHGPTYGMPDIF
jgi:hypothetical protein